MRHISTVFGVSILALSSLVRADFTPPKDGKLTETQVTKFIAVSKAQVDALKAAGKAGEGTTSGAAAMAIYAHASDKIDAALKDSGLSKEEYEWVAGEVGKLWPVALMQQQWTDNAKPDLEKQIKSKQDDAATNKTKIENYQQAQKADTRVLSKEQRESAVASAMSGRDSIAAEVKTDQDAIKAISDEIAQHNKDAADAEALAKNPPADVSADDKNGYIDGKKNEAQTARDAAKDATDRLKEAQKNMDDANARLAAANGKLAHPEVPVSDDEKSAAKTENDQAITDARTAISDDEQAITTLKGTIAAGPMHFAGNEKDKPDPDNLALVQKHLKDYLSAIGAGDLLKAK